MLDGKAVVVARDEDKEVAERVAEYSFEHAAEPEPLVEIVRVTLVVEEEVVKVLTPELVERRKRKDPHTPDTFIEKKMRWA